MVNTMTENGACICDETPETNYISVRPGSHGDDYGKPLPGTLTEMRAQVANIQINKEILQLCGIIESKGFFNGKNPNVKCILFGNLFNIYNNVSDKCVGILLRARKHKFVQFDGEMLYQRRDDDVPIFLIKTAAEIKESLKLGEDKLKDSPSHSTAVLVDQSIRSTQSKNIPQGSADVLDCIDQTSITKPEPLKNEKNINESEIPSVQTTNKEVKAGPQNSFKQLVKDKKTKITSVSPADSAASVVVISKSSRMLKKIPDIAEEKSRVKKSFSRTKQSNLHQESIEVRARKFNNSKESHRSFITNKLKIPSSLTQNTSSHSDSGRNSQIFENKHLKDVKCKKLCVSSMESAASVAIISKTSKTGDSIRVTAPAKSQMKSSLIKLKQLQSTFEPPPIKKPKTSLNMKSLTTEINSEVIKYKNQRFNKKPSKIAMLETKDVKSQKPQIIKNKLSKNSLIPLPVQKNDIEESKSQKSMLNMKPLSTITSEENYEITDTLVKENKNKKLLMNVVSKITMPEKQIYEKIDSINDGEIQSCQDSVLTIVKKLESNKKKNSISEKFSNFAFKSRSSVREPTTIFQEPILVDEPIIITDDNLAIEECHYDEGEEEMTMDEYEEPDGFRIFCDDTDSDSNSTQLNECDYFIQEESLFSWLKKVFVQFFFLRVLEQKTMYEVESLDSILTQCFEEKIKIQVGSFGIQL